MNNLYVGSEEDYIRPLAAPAAGGNSVWIMLKIVGHIMDNYEVLEVEGRCV